MDQLWDIRVSLDLFLGGVGIGAYLVGALLFAMDRDAYHGLIKKSFVVAPIAVIAGLLMLLTELGRPLNVIKTLYSINPSSFMSIGIFLQLAFVMATLILVYLMLAKGPQGTSGIFVYLTAGLAGMVGLYHGFLLNGISIEPWDSAIPIIFFASSILAGASFIFLLGLDQLESIAARTRLPVIMNVILTIQLAAIFAWIYDLALTADASQSTYGVLMSHFSVEFWGLSIVIGLLVPLTLFTLALAKKVSFKSVYIPASGAIIVGSFFLKNLVVYLGQAI